MGDLADDFRMIKIWFTRRQLLKAILRGGLTFECREYGEWYYGLPHKAEKGEE